jgi:hypothetical protein
MAGPTERTGVLVLRTWLEADDPVLRASITGRFDVKEPGETSVVVAGRHPTVAAVNRWLERFELGDDCGLDETSGA